MVPVHHSIGLCMCWHVCLGCYCISVPAGLRERFLCVNGQCVCEESLIDVVYLCKKKKKILPSPAVFDWRLMGTCFPYSFIKLGMIQSRLCSQVGCLSCIEINTKLSMKPLSEFIL